ncbi:organomercurial lyase [Streptomyces sp. NPDC056257]|uniref:organomercurial lyase n=1 Tax=Streptomyces sp. NPDC056257 TaxID=3345765 RepID=UPI0035E2C688
MPSARVQQLSDQLVAKWTSPQGAELMAAGAVVVGGLLAYGPLSLQEAGGLLDWPADEVLVRFHAMGFDLETDDRGRVIGAGVSLDDRRPHSVQLQGQQVHGWCAMDVLMFPIVLKEPASTVTSPCAATSEPITLTVTPDGVHDLSPSTTAVTLAPASGGDIREVFCDRVNFYATADLAEAVVERDGDLAVCSVDEAWVIGKRLADLF